MHYPAGFMVDVGSGYELVTESRWVEHGQDPREVCPWITMGAGDVVYFDYDFVRWIAWSGNYGQGNPFTIWRYIGDMSAEQKITSAKTYGKIHHKAISSVEWAVPPGYHGPTYLLTDLEDWDSDGTDFEPEISGYSNTKRILSIGNVNTTTEEYPEEFSLGTLPFYVDGWEYDISSSFSVQASMPTLNEDSPARLIKIGNGVYGFVEFVSGIGYPYTNHIVIMGAAMEKLKTQLTKILNIQIIDMPSIRSPLPPAYYITGGGPS
jgi:hypothetical protein